MRKLENSKRWDRGQIKPAEHNLDSRAVVKVRFFRRRTVRLSCRGRLQHLCAARNQDGGPGQLQPLVSRFAAAALLADR